MSIRISSPATAYKGLKLLQTKNSGAIYTKNATSHDNEAKTQRRAESSPKQLDVSLNCIVSYTTNLAGIE